MLWLLKLHYFVRTWLNLYFFVRIKLNGFVINPLWYIGILVRNQTIRLISLISLGSLFILLFIVYGTYFYLSGDVDKKILNHYLSLHRYRTAIAIRDNKNNLIGTIPSPLEPPTKNFAQNQREGALYVETIPPVFWDVLKAREDQHLDFDYSQISFGDIITFKKRSYKGIDIFAVPYRFLSSQGEAGGSGLINIMIKNIYGQGYFAEKYGKGWWGKFRRKFYEFQGARHIFPYLAKNDGIEFRRWSAMHAPLLVAEGSVYGIQAVSATVFGKKPKDLSDGEQAILAAAYLRDIRFQPSFDNAPKLAQERQERWNRIIKSAKEGSKNAYKEKNQAKYEAIKTELDKFVFPNEPHVPKSLEDLLSQKTFEEKQKYANLITRVDALIPGLKGLIKSQTKERYEELAENEILTEVKITLPVSKNYRFKRRIDDTLKKIEKKIPFNKALVSSSENEGMERADIRIVVAKLSGEIIRYYRRGEFLEENSGYHEDNGRNKALRPIASIAKIPAAVILGYLGDKPHARVYCNKAAYKKDGKRFQNASAPQKYGVKDCNKGMYTPIETFAASRNLPLRYALSERRNLSKKQLIQLYKAFGIFHPDMFHKGRIITSEQLVHGLSFGVAEATPMQIHRIIHELTAILYSKTVREPYFIESIKISEINLENVSKITTHPPTVQKTIDVKDYLKTDSAKTFLKNVLSAPVYFETGTLRSFKRIRGVEFILVKSGTYDTSDKLNVKDKWVVGSMKIKGEIYTFSILVGSIEYGGEGLAKKVRHSTLMMPIVREIVKSLQ